MLIKNGQKKKKTLKLILRPKNSLRSQKKINFEIFKRETTDRIVLNDFV